MKQWETNGLGYMGTPQLKGSTHSFGYVCCILEHQRVRGVDRTTMGVSKPRDMGTTPPSNHHNGRHDLRSDGLWSGRQSGGHLSGRWFAGRWRGNMFPVFSCMISEWNRNDQKLCAGARRPYDGRGRATWGPMIPRESQWLSDYPSVNWGLLIIRWSHVLWWVKWPTFRSLSSFSLWHAQFLWGYPSFWSILKWCLVGKTIATIVSMAISGT